MVFDAGISCVSFLDLTQQWLVLLLIQLAVKAVRKVVESGADAVWEMRMELWVPVFEVAQPSLAVAAV